MYRKMPQLPAKSLMSRWHTAYHQLTPQTASPSLVQGNIAEKILRSMAQNNQRVFQPFRYFLKGEKVFMKPRHGNRLDIWWSTAPRSCTVNISMGAVQSNHTQIREAIAEPEEGGDDRLETAQWACRNGSTSELGTYTTKRARAYGGPAGR